MQRPANTVRHFVVPIVFSLSFLVSACATKDYEVIDCRTTWGESNYALQTCIEMQQRYEEVDELIQEVRRINEENKERQRLLVKQGIINTPPQI